jgi:hypothetical protein
MARLLQAAQDIIISAGVPCARILCVGYVGVSHVSFFSNLEGRRDAVCRDAEGTSVGWVCCPGKMSLSGYCMHATVPGLLQVQCFQRRVCVSRRYDIAHGTAK